MMSMSLSLSGAACCSYGVTSSFTPIGTVQRRLPGKTRALHLTIHRAAVETRSRLPFPSECALFRMPHIPRRVRDKYEKREFSDILQWPHNDLVFCTD